LSRCEQAESAINEFKQLLRRFIAVDLSGFSQRSTTETRRQAHVGPG
jgi:hypothetical protein